MRSQESKKLLRFFGIEFRIIFGLVALILALVVWSSFKSAPWLSILFFVLFVFSVFLIWLDYSCHFVSLTSDGLIFQRILWRKLALWKVYIGWKEVEKMTTSTYGLFKSF
ncbi:MAG: hypothetical protein AMJ73_09560 [candidate division Zixibacteria bacterium SM1_73]|nr:MAG: hypothetical protein AMJ73_09560 [candidate division Zixibacteria bacterium SM1_73]